MSPTMSQTSYHLICQVLREFLVEVVKSRDRATVATIPFQASATLYALLLDHPPDRRGRCQSCRRPAAMIRRRRRRCQVYLMASFYLLYSGDSLLPHVAGELGLGQPGSIGQQQVSNPHTGQATPVELCRASTSTSIRAALDGK
ncbi:MAG: hypothetical protein M3460_17250 [Actinomycetota bacterium]|nr:hypothetical protein [Actinomycetota bacterium]